MTVPPPRACIRCSICLDLLNMPVVLSCTHRFCYGCLSQAAVHTLNHQCPLCKKETDLDPTNYEIDPVLNRFVSSHFAHSGKASPRARTRSPHALEQLKSAARVGAQGKFNGADGDGACPPAVMVVEDDATADAAMVDASKTPSPAAIPPPSPLAPPPPAASPATTPSPLTSANVMESADVAAERAVITPPPSLPAVGPALLHAPAHPHERARLKPDARVWAGRHHLNLVATPPLQPPHDIATQLDAAAPVAAPIALSADICPTPTEKRAQAVKDAPHSQHAHLPAQHAHLPSQHPYLAAQHAQPIGGVSQPLGALNGGAMPLLGRVYGPPADMLVGGLHLGSGLSSGFGREHERATLLFHQNRMHHFQALSSFAAASNTAAAFPSVPPHLLAHLPPPLGSVAPHVSAPAPAPAADKDCAMAPGLLPLTEGGMGMRPSMATDPPPPALEQDGAPRKRACVECHRAKSACEGDPTRPCCRCVRLGKACVTEERKKRRRRDGDSAPAANAFVSAANVAAGSCVSTPPGDRLLAPVSSNAALSIDSAAAMPQRVPPVPAPPQPAGAHCVAMTLKIAPSVDEGFTPLSSGANANGPAAHSFSHNQQLGLRGGELSPARTGCHGQQSTRPLSKSPTGAAAAGVPSVAATADLATDNFLDFSACELSSFLTDLDAEMNPTVAT